MAQSGLEVVGIVRRGDLHRAGSEFGIRQLVQNDGNLAIHQRQQDFGLVQMPVALVAGIDHHRRVAQHGFRAGGRDDNEIR